MKQGLTKNYGMYDVSITKHALKRMIQRNIYRDGIIQSILKIIHSVTAQDQKIILVFRQDNFSLVIKKENNSIVIITAIRGYYESNGQELRIVV